MPKASRTRQRWATIHTAGLGLTAFTFGVPTDEPGNTGAWWYLKGCSITLDKREYDAHITITKQPADKPRVDTDQWNFCHVSLITNKNNHIFYEVKDDGTYKLTQTVYDQEGAQHSGADKINKVYPGKSQINDPAVRDAIDHDILLIFRYLAQ